MRIGMNACGKHNWQGPIGTVCVVCQSEFERSGEMDFRLRPYRVVGIAAGNVYGLFDTIEDAERFAKEKARLEYVPESAFFVE